MAIKIPPSAGFFQATGAAPGNDEATNTAAIQSALDAANAAGGGTVILFQPGVYAVKPILRIWPNTRVTLGRGVTLQNGDPSRTGVMFGVIYNSITRTGATAGASASITVANAGDMSVHVGAPVVIYSGTNFIAGNYVVVSATAGTITLDRVCSTGNGSNLVGALGYAMFRDAAADGAAPARSDRITIDGEGIIDGNTMGTGFIGYFNRAIWMRKTSHLAINEVSLINWRIYASMIEDCSDFMSRGVKLNTYRDGLHFSGPIARCTIRDLTGTAGDNSIAFVTAATPDYAPGSDYTIGDSPHTSFGDVSDVTIENTNLTAAYNFIRFTGPSSRTLSGVHIKGVHGSIAAGMTGAGRHPIVFMDDGADLTGMVMKGIVIEDVDATCLEPVTALSGSPNLSVTAPNTVTRASGNFITEGITGGMFATLSGFSNAPNNGFFRVVTATATTLVLETIAMTTEASGAGKTVLWGDFSAEVFSFASGLRDLTAKNIFVSGHWQGVQITNGPAITDLNIFGVKSALGLPANYLVSLFSFNGAAPDASSALARARSDMLRSNEGHAITDWGLLFEAERSVELANTSAVAAASDVSGNRVDTTGASGATLQNNQVNGLPVFRFTGSGSFLRLPQYKAVLNPKTITIFAAAKLGANAGGSVLLMKDYDFGGSPITSSYCLDAAGTGQQGMAFYDGSWHTSQVNTNVRNDGKWHIFAGRADGANLEFWLDGVRDSRNIYSATLPTGNTSNVYIASDVTDGIALAADLQMIGMVPRACSDLEMVAEMAYLRRKLGLI